MAAKKAMVHRGYLAEFSLLLYCSSPGHNQIWIYDDVTHICKMAPTPRNRCRGKVTSWLFGGPRSVLSPYYFESCDFRQWEIRGEKKKCRPMNVCTFLGGKTTEHENFSAQRNARQGAKHRKKEGECHFLDLWKKFFLNLHKNCLLIVVCLV